MNFAFKPFNFKPTGKRLAIQPKKQVSSSTLTLIEYSPRSERLATVIAKGDKVIDEIAVGDTIVLGDNAMMQRVVHTIDGVPFYLINEDEVLAILPPNNKQSIK